MAGVIDFYKECKKQNIHPLLGMEAYITEDEDGMEEGKTRDNMHMVLIARDNIGYQLLLEEASNAALNNFYYKPRINKKRLERLSGHVIASSACLGGIICKKIELKKDEGGRVLEAEETEVSIKKELEYYASIFNNENNTCICFVKDCR